MATNVKHEVKGKKLIITVDLDQDFGYSKSGKTKTVGTTHGFTQLDGKYAGTMFLLNVNRK